MPCGRVTEGRLCNLSVSWNWGAKHDATFARSFFPQKTGWVRPSMFIKQ